jgi:surfeit locus 1 family protein
MAFKLDSICARCRRQQIRFYNNNQVGDDARWLSVVDHPAQIVRTGRKHGPGLIILGTADKTLADLTGP